jgi:hypothetical protein
VYQLGNAWSLQLVDERIEQQSLCQLVRGDFSDSFHVILKYVGAPASRRPSIVLIVIMNTQLWGSYSLSGRQQYCAFRFPVWWTQLHVRSCDWQFCLVPVGPKWLMRPSA